MFIDNQSFIIKERVAIIQDSYKISAPDGHFLGEVRQNKSFSNFILGYFFSERTRPCELIVYDANDTKICSIRKGWTIFRIKVTIRDAEDKKLAYYRKDLINIFTPKFTVYNIEGRKIARIKGDIFKWNYEILDTDGREVGSVCKKWNGMIKEFFTTADKYRVDISASVTNQSMRLVIFSVAVATDQLFKEHNHATD